MFKVSPCSRVMFVLVIECYVVRTGDARFSPKCAQVLERGKRVASPTLENRQRLQINPDLVKTAVIVLVFPNMPVNTKTC